jgi:hypothetical protein
MNSPIIQTLEKEVEAGFQGGSFFGFFWFFRTDPPG